MDKKEIDKKEIDKKETYVPSGGPPRVSLPSSEIYASMGEDNFFKMLEDFYLELEKSDIRHLFPKDMIKASHKNALFFIQICGGPPLYQEKRGAPRLRERHSPFAIDEKARKTWLSCFHKVLENGFEKYSFPKKHLSYFKYYLDVMSCWMVNQKS